MGGDDPLWDRDPLINCCVSAIVVYVAGVVFVGGLVWLGSRLL